MIQEKKFNRTDIIITNIFKEDILSKGLNGELPIKIIVLSYNQDTMNAPRVIVKYRRKSNSKFIDNDNSKILIEFLKSNDAMIISNSYIVNKLYKSCRLNKEIDEKYYNIVAKLYKELNTYILLMDNVAITKK